MFRLGIISDIHVGSAFAPCPKKFVTSMGTTVVMNRGQKYIYKNMMDIAKRLPYLDLLVVNGDAIDGQQPKQEGLYVIEPDPQFQARAALELLEPFAQKAKAVLVTEGSDYHTGNGATWCEWLARELRSPKDEFGHHAWARVPLDIDGVTIDISHHISKFIQYQSSSAEREMQFNVRLPPELLGGADLIVRSHIHEFLVLKRPRGFGHVLTIVVTPGWKLMGHWGAKTKMPN